VRLSGAVLIVDEAHNLPEAVADAAAAALTGAAAAAAAAALSAYLGRYRPRLSAGNLRHLGTLLLAARAMQRAVAAAPAGAAGAPADVAGCSGAAARVLKLNEFLFEAGIDHINLFKLSRFCRDRRDAMAGRAHLPCALMLLCLLLTPGCFCVRSKVLFKVGGFGDAAAAAAAAASGPQAVCESAHGGAEGGATAGGTTAALQSLLSFLGALTSPDGDGRVLLTRAGAAGGATAGGGCASGRLKFTLLNPGARFAPIAAAARAVILAGGTLGPLSALSATLFPGLPLTRLRAHACGHIVPPAQLLCLALGRGPSGAALDFAFRARTSEAAMDELGRLLLNVCRVIPQGVVAFFPSFDYADACAARWAASGAADALAAVKTVFREPRTASAVEALLSRYAAAALAPRAGGAAAGGPSGALLLCVVGGKLSEGINFSDGLGRCAIAIHARMSRLRCLDACACANTRDRVRGASNSAVVRSGVVLVGLPYAPPSDAELSERMRWLDAAGADAGGGPGAGRAHYEALCMRAVNQSIGRAIRHAKDYAAIVLADARWTKPGAMRLRMRCECVLGLAC
jgi:chromosome transmission fidelity protein 1